MFLCMLSRPLAATLSRHALVQPLYVCRRWLLSSLECCIKESIPRNGRGRAVSVLLAAVPVMLVAAGAAAGLATRLLERPESFGAMPCALSTAPSPTRAVDTPYYLLQ